MSKRPSSKVSQSINLIFQAMQTNIKETEAFFGMGFVSEKLCFFGRKFGSVSDGFQKGELFNLNRHGIHI